MKAIQKELNKLFEITHSKQDINLVKLYQDLITEEFSEFITAKTEPEKCKELLDLLWVTIQYANAKGWDLDKGMKLLIEEYKSKFLDETGNYSPIFRDDGKLLKNKGFKKLDPTKLI